MSEVTVYQLQVGEQPVFDIPDVLGEKVEITGSGKPDIMHDRVRMDCCHTRVTTANIPNEFDLLIIGITSTGLVGWLVYKKK